MVGSFKHTGLKRFFDEGDARKLPPEMVTRIHEILTTIHAAETLDDMNLHGYRLHDLKGNRKGEWSITVRANWRITFRFEQGVAVRLNLEDYHAN